MSAAAAMLPLPEQAQDRTIIDLFTERAGATPNRMALVASSAYGGEDRLTYGQLLWQAQRFADAMRSFGVKQGDHVGLMMDNHAAREGVISILGLWLMGAVTVFLNARYANEELVHALKLSRCTVALGMSPCFARLRSAAGALEPPPRLIEVGPASDGAVPNWSMLLDQADARNAPGTRPKPGDVSEILFTSGTTGYPKAAQMTHQSAVASGYGFTATLSLVGTDTLQTFFPFFTTAFIRCALIPCWWAGCTIVVDRALDTEEVVARMMRERSNKYIGTPTIYLFLLDIYDPKRHDLSHCRLFDGGGASFSREVVKKMSALFPQIELRTTYGMTESGGSGTFLSGEHALSKLGSAGRPYDPSEVKIVSDNGKTLPAGEMGEIAIRTPCMMTCYMDNPEATREAVKDGWMHTGDIGYFDEDGFLYVADRKKDMIIRGGHNIASLEVESVMARCPGVKEAAVVSIPHEKLGEDIFAFVVPTPESTLTVDQLRAFCDGKLSDYKIPRKYAFVESLPRSPMAKVLKNELRKMAIAQVSA